MTGPEFIRILTGSNGSGNRLPALWRSLLGWVLIAGSSFGAVALHVLPSAPIAPIPVYQKTTYQLHVLVDGRPLTADAVTRRYQLPISGVSPLKPEGLRAIIRRREADTPGDQPVYVRLHTRENGGEETVWLWPES